MIDYKGQLNLGNEAFGTEKTITANEVLRTAEADALAREISHQNPLIPEQVAKAVRTKASRTKEVRVDRTRAVTMAALVAALMAVTVAKASTKTNEVERTGAIGVPVRIV